MEQWEGIWFFKKLTKSGPHDNVTSGNYLEATVLVLGSDVISVETPSHISLPLPLTGSRHSLASVVEGEHFGPFHIPLWMSVIEHQTAVLL